MASLTSEQRAAFDRDGYVIVHDLFDPVRDLASVIAEDGAVLDRLAHELHGVGEIDARYADLPFSGRLTRSYGESGRTRTTPTSGPNAGERPAAPRPRGRHVTPAEHSVLSPKS